MDRFLARLECKDWSYDARLDLRCWMTDIIHYIHYSLVTHHLEVLPRADHVRRSLLWKVAIKPCCEAILNISVLFPILRSS